MPEITDNVIKSAASVVISIDTSIEQLRDCRENIARPVEQAAHRIFQARHAYRRTGMYPEMAEVDWPNGISFKVSNGIDHGDDFGASLTFDELAEDPEIIRAAAETQRTASVRRAALDKLNRAKEHAKNVGAIR